MKIALLAISNFKNHKQLNFHKTSTAKNIHEITLLIMYNFKIFRGSIPPDPPKLFCPFGRFGRIGRHLKFSPPVMLHRISVKTSAKNSDRGRYREDADQETAPWRLH